MKMTLLELVQDILSDMDSDEVNSINDTVEALQVAQVVKTTYYELIANKNWPHLKKYRTLESVSDTNTPTHLQLPEDIKELIFLKYNKRRASDTKDKFEDVIYKHPEDFINLTNRRNSGDSNIQTVTDVDGAVLYIRNDLPPQYWTSFDDVHLVMDSFDSEIEDTLTSGKTQSLMYIEPAWTMDDDFVPDFPQETFSYLLAEAKSVAFSALKKEPNAKAEQQSRRQRAWNSRKAWQAKGGIRFPNYGRVPHTSRSQFDKDAV
jgi:hypothetical protein